jgi:Ca-activated chloride channel family protein
MTLFSLKLVNPQALLALPLILIFLWWSFRGRAARRRSLGFSTLLLLEWSKSAVPLRLSRRTEILHVLFWSLLLLTLARPQQSLGEKPQTKEGIDILLCLDTSQSMEAQDLLPNRLEAAKAVSKAFVESRKDDRIGLVVFSGIALTQCPLTSDHGTLQSFIDNLRPGMIPIQGTAIGNGLATSVNRLKDLPGKSKVIILLTDGRSNAGEIEPLQAAELAASYGLRVYAIGVGTEDSGLTSLMGGAGGIDMETLTKMAQRTGGKAFRATNNQALVEIYNEIDRLERVKREEKPEILYRELMIFPGMAALLILTFLMGGRLRRELV